MNAAVVHVVLLLVVKNDPSSATVSRAVIDALATPFVEPPRVVSRELPSPPTAPEIDVLASEAKADAVVVLACGRSGCEQADLRVVAAGQPSMSRVVRFGPRDEPVERGRAIGLLASALLPSEWSRIGGPSAPPQRPEPESAAPPVVAPAVSAAMATAPSHWAFETVGEMFAGASAGVSDVGLTLAVERALAGQWAARVAFKLSLGEMPNGAGTSRGVGGLLGVAWTSAGLARPGHFGVGLRIDAIVLEREARLSAPEPRQASRASLGADAIGLVGFALSPSAAVLAGVGGQFLGAGPSVGDDDDPLQRRSEPAALRLVAEIGVRARF